jgi:transaldolase
MKFFLDTTDITEIKELKSTGMIDGVTTNPSLAAASGKPFIALLEEICSIITGPVSAEVTALNSDDMIKESRVLTKVAPNITIKVPLTPEGLKCCKALSDEGTMVNVTLCFSAAQALLAAKCGAAFISPFVGRVEDIGGSGMNLIEEICQIYSNYGYDTEVLVASVRNTGHILESALIGAHVITMPPSAFKQLYKHPLTDNGLTSFMKDWDETGQSILDQ